MQRHGEVQRCGCEHETVGTLRGTKKGGVTMDTWARTADRIEAMQHENRFGLSGTQLKQSGGVEFVVGGGRHVNNLKRWLETNILDGGRITLDLSERTRNACGPSRIVNNGNTGAKKVYAADKARDIAGVRRVRLVLVKETGETLWQMVDNFYKQNGIPGSPREPPYIFKSKDQKQTFLSLVVSRDSMKKIHQIAMDYALNNPVYKKRAFKCGKQPDIAVKYDLNGLNEFIQG